MTAFFKYLTLSVLWFLINPYCQASNNYIIIVDLSDRITVNGQQEQDKAVISALFNEFVSEVKRASYINSKASFKVVLAPQEFIAYDKNKFEADLLIDLSTLPILAKKKTLDAFALHFNHTINLLYAKAHTSNNKKQYAGCDLWQYFNDYLASDIKTNQPNKVYVLTDGYFDFENNPNIKHVSNQSTSTHFMSKLNSNNWKTIFIQNNMGLIPIVKKWYNSEINVIGINPKSTDLNEIEKLSFIWQTWLKASGLKQGKLIISTNAKKILVQLKN